jgi:hypothetical protein
MTTFKSIAYQILKEADKPLHSKEITKRALARGLVSEGKTPEATMNALLITDINSKKEKSRFIKTAPSIFAINPDFTETLEKIMKEEQAEKRYTISKAISSKQKGDIAEARVAELVTLYGETSLSCYKPISDDEGIDLIVKQKGNLKTMYIQIKSRFGSPEGIYTATVKAESVLDNYSMALVFCFFDTDKGDVWDYVWFVPAPDFVKLANKLQNGKMLGFVAGRGKRESNKWDQYLIDKRDLASEILNQMKRI